MPAFKRARRCATLTPSRHGGGHRCTTERTHRRRSARTEARERALAALRLQHIKVLGETSAVDLLVALSASPHLIEQLIEQLLSADDALYVHFAVGVLLTRACVFAVFSNHSL